MFGRGDYKINNDWNVYFNASLNKTKSFGRFAALPSSPWPGGAIELTPDSPNHPGNPNGYNPHATDPYYAALAGETLSLYHRFAALGPRDNQVENTTTNFNGGFEGMRSEEHTSELQSRPHLVCRLLLEKKKQIRKRSPVRRGRR